MRSIIQKFSVTVLAAMLCAAFITTTNGFCEDGDGANDNQTIGTSISISPVSKILQLSASSVYEDSFSVSNNGSSDMKFEVYAAPYSYSYSETDDSYQLGFNKENTYTQITRWITFKQADGNYAEKATFTAAPNTSVDVTYRISTPESIPAGGQYAVLFAHTLSGEVNGSGIKTEASPGLVVYGRAEGETNASSEISDLQISSTLTVDNQEKNIINASAKVKNTGNVDFMASGKLKVTGIFGQTYYETTGVSAKSRVSIIPESELLVSDSWDETPFFGLFNVEWTVTGNGGTSETITKFVVIMPPVIIITAILLLTIVIVWIIIVIRKRKERRSKFMVQAAHPSGVGLCRTKTKISNKKKKVECMRKTHKKILGFAGLGLVAAVTTVAATMPSPALATGAYEDVIKVRVIPAESDIQITPADGGEIHVPEYAFDVLYSGITDIKAEIVNRDADGNIIFGPTEIWHIDADWNPDTKHFDLNLDDYGGYGNFTITVIGSGVGGVPVEKTATVKYSKEGGKEIDGGEIEADPDTGDANTDVDVPSEGVESVTLNIYDDTGNKVKGPISISNPSSIEGVDLSDLPDGVYTGEIISKDSDGDVLDVKYITIVIDRDSGGENVGVEVKDHEKEITKAVVTIRDKDGNIVGQKEFDHPTPGTNMDIELDGDLPAGIYTVTTDYYDEDDEIVDTVVTTLVKAGTDGHADIGIDTEIDTVKTIVGDIYDENGGLVRVVRADRETGTLYVYDPNGNLIDTIPNGYSETGGLNIPFTGLPYGEYTVKVSFLNQYDKPVGDIYVYKVLWYGRVPVPDTGGLFQGLNISREDYLITGLVVFMVIGVVAFGVVAKSKRGKTSRKHRRQLKYCAGQCVTRAAKTEKNRHR